MVKLSKERMDYTIDLLIAMVVEEIAEETGQDRKDTSIVNDFLVSGLVGSGFDLQNGFCWTIFKR